MVPWNEWLLSNDCSCFVDDKPATTLTWSRSFAFRTLHFPDYPEVPGLPPTGPYTYSAAWNAMVHPLLNMTIKGVAWYQGMYLLRRLMNSLLWLRRAVDSRKRADVWNWGHFTESASCFHECSTIVPRTTATWWLKENAITTFQLRKILFIVVFVIVIFSFYIYFMYSVIQTTCCSDWRRFVMRKKNIVCNHKLN